jgi:hypothetical protein
MKNYMETLSAEMIQEILKNLKIKDLLQMRRVSPRIRANADFLLLGDIYSDDLHRLFELEIRCYFQSCRILQGHLKYPNSNLLNGLQFCFKVRHSSKLEVGEVFDVSSQRNLDFSGNCRVQVRRRGRKTHVLVSNGFGEDIQYDVRFRSLSKDIHDACLLDLTGHGPYNLKENKVINHDTMLLIYRSSRGQIVEGNKEIVFVRIDLLSGEEKTIPSISPNYPDKRCDNKFWPSKDAEYKNNLAALVSLKRYYTDEVDGAISEEGSTEKCSARYEEFKYAVFNEHLTEIIYDQKLDRQISYPEKFCTTMMRLNEKFGHPILQFPSPQMIPFMRSVRLPFVYSSLKFNLVFE